MEIKKIKNLGQFYTKKEVVKQTFDIFLKKIKNKINLDEYIFIEPSAGTGEFINIINDKYNIRGFNIDPKQEYIIKKDYLKESIGIKDKQLNGKKTIIIGNPPFGKRGKTALDFINKSTEYTDIIAFIFPNCLFKISYSKKCK